VIAIRLDYCCSAETIAVLQLVSPLEKAGQDVKIFSTTSRFNRVHPDWDQLLSKESLDSALCTGDVTHVVYPRLEVPTLDDVHEKAKRVFICQWSRYDPHVAGDIANRTDVVLCPSRPVFRYMESVKATICYTPWSIVSPPIRNDRRDVGKLGFLWYISDEQSGCGTLPFIVCLREILKACPDVYGTVVCLCQPVEELVLSLRQLQYDTDGQLEVLFAPNYEKLLLLWASHDLAVYTGATDDFGLFGLLTSTCGVPCVAPDHPSIGEIVKDGVHGVLAPCDLAYNNLMNAPEAIEEPDVIKRHVLSLIKYPERLHKLGRSAQLGLLSRRRSFEEAITTLFCS
jgi:hypothetical protein